MNSVGTFPCKMNVRVLQLHLLMFIGSYVGMAAWPATLAPVTANSTIAVAAVAVACSLASNHGLGKFRYVFHTRVGQVQRPDISWLPGITLADASMTEHSHNNYPFVVVSTSTRRD
eukprot:COSAG02_NODE_678_length_18586_cov_39.649375_3_plen_116_part_00